MICKFMFDTKFVGSALCNVQERFRRITDTSELSILLSRFWVYQGVTLIESLLSSMQLCLCVFNFMCSMHPCYWRPSGIKVNGLKRIALVHVELEPRITDIVIDRHRHACVPTAYLLLKLYKKYAKNYTLLYGTKIGNSIRKLIMWKQTLVSMFNIQQL